MLERGGRRRGELAAIRLVDEEPAPGARHAAMPGPTPSMLARGLASRIGHINDEVMRLSRLARGEKPPAMATALSTLMFGT